MKITLADNALDFILSALEHAQVSDVRNLKYAVLHLSDGVELILKERLKREHWSLLFSDVSQANPNKLKSGNFKSVDFDECIKRLENVSGISLKKSHKDLLFKLRTERNKLQHFEYSGSKDEVISIIVKTWGVVLDFLHDYLDDVVEDQHVQIDKLRRLMVEHEAFLNERLVEIKPKIEQLRASHNAVLECPCCMQEALVIPGDSQPNCVFCRYSATPEDAVNKWNSAFFGFQSPKDEYMNPRIFECPECGSETLIQQEFGDIWVCFNCGMTWAYDEMHFCDMCGKPYGRGEDDAAMCSDCWDTLIKRD